MARCTAIKPDGERCTLAATGQHGLCWTHAPENAAQRRRTASRGGRSKANREIKALKSQLREIASGVLDGSIQQGRGAVSVQALNALARVLELERRWKELGEIEDQLDALERQLDPRRGKVS
jgi:hypothetical protein